MAWSSIHRTGGTGIPGTRQKEPTPF